MDWDIILHCNNVELYFFQANYPVAKPLGLKVTFKYEENKSRLVEWSFDWKTDSCSIDAREGSY